MDPFWISFNLNYYLNIYNLITSYIILFKSPHDHFMSRITEFSIKLQNIY